MRARFIDRQPAVKWQELGNGLVDVSICINETEAEEIIEMEKEKAIQHYFEYDFNQFREDATKLNRAFVEGNPEKFIDYIPAKGETLPETVARQGEEIQSLSDCVLEMSEIIYQ